jgi:uncharacterized protein (DUF433 family)
MNLPSFLTQWPYGEIMLTGHRIGLYHVVADYRDGMTAEQLRERYPTLSLELIHKVLAFYHENETAVNDYVTRTREELDRQEAAAPRMNLEELRRRYEAKKAAQAK